MKIIKIVSMSAFLIIAAIAATAFIRTKAPSTVKSADNKGFALVELFTSEGCSSCPPADELVARVQKESKDKQVYILAYHVDYWNRLGWKDQFSSADFSKRQNEYANYLHLESVYTPQIVVNGKTEFVGSEEGSLRKAIQTNLQKNPGGKLALNISGQDQNSANIKYTIDGAGGNPALFIAVVQKAAQTKVQSGENGGRTLSHVQIVRKLQKVTLNNNSGTVNVSLPHGFNAQGWEIIGFAQNTSNGAITAAAKAPINNEETTSAAVGKDLK